ncbi:hypothetical protein Tco_1154782 [Tanacetum coccineum]
MAEYPQLTTIDRADIIDRVFEMKIHQFIHYLRDGATILQTVAERERPSSLPHALHDKMNRYEYVETEDFRHIYISAPNLPSKEKIRKHACEALGLLEDDREWETTLKEAVVIATPAELRTLLAHILSFCQVSDPIRLWKRTWKRRTHTYISVDDVVPHGHDGGEVELLEVGQQQHRSKAREDKRVSHGHRVNQNGLILQDL